MRVIITGGAGQIGSFLCRSQLGQGREVVCVDNLVTGVKENIADLIGSSGFEFLNHDVSEPIHIEGKIDRIYHLASPASPPEYVMMPIETLAVNSIGTLNLLRLARSVGARFLFASTSEVYGDPQVHPQTEDYWGNVNPIGVRSCYDEGKRFGEALTAAYARNEGVDTRVVRIFNTYGPNNRPDDGRMVPNFISQALQGAALTIYGSGNQTRSLCYVTDTVDAIERTMDYDLQPGETINIGNPEEHTVEEFAHAIAKACGVTLRIERRELPADDPARRCPDISKARRLIGWQPSVSLEQGLDWTAQWFRERLGLPSLPSAPRSNSRTLL